MTLASVGWTPSDARTVQVVEPSSAQLRGVTVAVVPLAWPAKAPAEQLDYSLDLSLWLEDADDDLVQASASVSPAAHLTDLGIIWCSVISGLVVLFLAGGTIGTSYTVLVTARTVAGRIAVFPVSLTVSDATPSVTPPEPVMITAPYVAALAGGAALLLPDGSELLIPTPSGVPAYLAASLAPNTLMISGSEVLLVGGTPLLLE